LGEIQTFEINNLNTQLKIWQILHRILGVVLERPARNRSQAKERQEDNLDNHLPQQPAQAVEPGRRCVHLDRVERLLVKGPEEVDSAKAVMGSRQQVWAA